MNGCQSDNPEQEPGEAGELEAQVAPSDDDRERRARESLQRRERAFTRRTLGASQATRKEKAQARRKVRQRGRR